MSSRVEKSEIQSRQEGAEKTELSSEMIERGFESFSYCPKSWRFYFSFSGTEKKKVYLELNLGGVFQSDKKFIFESEFKEFSELVELTVESCYETQAFRIMAATADNPVGSLRPFNWNRLAKYWGHLRHLKVMPFAEAPCEMIIGSDYPQLMTSLKEFRHSDELKAAPVARLTPLGLTIAGPLLPATEHRDVRIAEKYEAERRRFTSGSVSRRSDSQQ